MADIVTTFLFEMNTQVKESPTLGGRETGWTEQFVCQADNVNDPALTTKANAYSAARIKLLAVQAKITGYRYHSLGNNATRVVNWGPNPWVGASSDCTMPQIAMLCRLTATNGVNNRKLDLAGVPSNFVLTGELAKGNIPPGDLGSLFRAIVTNYGMLGVNKTFPHFKVKTVSPSGVVILAEDQVGIATGQTIKFYRTRLDGKCCGSLGTYKVATAAARVITLEDYTQTDTARGGKIAQWTKPAFLSFDTTELSSNQFRGAALQRSVIRKTGRPFDLFTGRRSKTCCKCP